MSKKYQVALATKTMIKDQSLLRHEDIKQHIRVVPELAAYIPPLLPDEYRQLEENIQLNGCREALLVWETTSGQSATPDRATPDYILIDGHNRYEICQKHNLDFKVHLMSFSSIDEVKFFMIDNQLGRRNLSPEQVSYLRGLRYLKEKQTKGKYQRDDHKGHSDPYELDSPDGSITTGDGEGRESTAHRIGKQFNVSEKTIKRDAAFARGLERLTPSFKQEILANRIKVDKALVQQLGQQEGPMEFVQNLAELEQISKPVSAGKKTGTSSDSPVSRKQVAQLKKQLRQLVDQLDAENADLALVCGQLIDCVRQFQKG